MLGDPEKILSPAKVLSNFIQANRGATARATLPTGESASRQPELAMLAYHCTRVAGYAHHPSSQSPTCPQELLKNHDEKTAWAKLTAPC